MNGLAVLFGINYSSTDSNCGNNVKQMGQFLHDTLKIPIKCYTDEKNVKKQSIVSKLYEIVQLSWQNQLDFVWLHYSGNGNSVKNACIVPIDYETEGVIDDEYMAFILRFINPKTRVICMFDSCNVKPVLDLTYKWNDDKCEQLQNKWSNVRAKVVSISGISPDSSNKKTITPSLLLSIQQANNKQKTNMKIFEIVNNINNNLMLRKINQRAIVNSTYMIKDDESLM